MRLNALELTDYRNIRTAYFEPGRELTVVCGENGQGKTNLLEAVWMLTGSKSFRGAKDAELVREGAQFAVVEGDVEAADGESRIGGLCYLRRGYAGLEEMLSGLGADICLREE